MTNATTSNAKLFIHVCQGATCGRWVAELCEVVERYREQNAAARARIEVCQDYCFDRCAEGPNVVVETADDQQRDADQLIDVMRGRSAPRMTVYSRVTAEQLVELCQRHLAATDE
ncbi:MAG: (2Fe-2S) ferredoxin domain-containing protein [Deltaproteobacteria bacterium]|nr:(2Fe-2S) ferredoxin domain-containing protein [Deltaproteobacteria bacterium]